MSSMSKETSDGLAALQQKQQQQQHIFPGFSKEVIKQLAANDLTKFASYMEIDCGAQLKNVGSEALIGKIPMFSNDPKPSLEHLDEAEKILISLVAEAKMKLGPGLNLVRTSLLTAMYTNPKEDARSQYIILPAAFLLAKTYLNQQLSSAHLVSSKINDANALASTLPEIIVNILKGTYAKSFEDVPKSSVTQPLEPILHLYWLIYKKYGVLIPTDAKEIYVKKELRDGLKGSAALRIKPLGHDCSNELFRHIRSADSNVGPFLEIITSTGLNHELQLESYVRKHVIYRNIKGFMGQDAGFIQDLFEFIAKMSNNENGASLNNGFCKDDDLSCTNHVFRCVEFGGMSYFEAFHQTLNLIAKLRKDLALLFDQLIEEFPEDENLVESIVLCKQAQDANVFVQLIAPCTAGLKLKEISTSS